MTFKNQSTTAVLIRPLPEGSYKIGSVHPSLLPSVLVLDLGIGSLDFSEFWHGTRNHYEVLHSSPIFLEKLFCPHNWGNRSKIGFFFLI